MRIAYDPEVDILTLWLREDTTPDGAVEVVPGTLVALDQQQTPVMVEIWDARQRYGATVDQFNMDALAPLVAVAREFGFSPVHFRILAAQGKLKAKKVGRNWLTTRAWVEDYLCHRKPTGPKRPSSLVGRIVSTWRASTYRPVG